MTAYIINAQVLEQPESPTCQLYNDLFATLHSAGHDIVVVCDPAECSFSFDVVRNWIAHSLQVSWDAAADLITVDTVPNVYSDTKRIYGKVAGVFVLNNGPQYSYFDCPVWEYN